MVYLDNPERAAVKRSRFRPNISKGNYGFWPASTAGASERELFQFFDQFWPQIGAHHKPGARSLPAVFLNAG